MKILLFLILIFLFIRNISLTRKIRRTTKRLEESEGRFHNKYVDDGHEEY